MPEWPDALLGQVGGPRPLPADLQSRLEHALLANAPVPDPTARPLGDELAARLEGALGDPVDDALTGIDGPRPLPPSTTASLERTLGPLRRRAPVVGAVAAAVVLLAGTAVTLTSVSHPSPGPSPQASAGAGSHGRSVPSAARPAPTTGQGARNGSSDVTSSGAAATGPAALGAASSASDLGKPPAPVIVGISPASGPTSGGTWVTIRGGGLGPTSTIQFGHVQARFHVTSDSAVSAQAPPHAAGTVDVRVTTSVTSPLTSADRFTYRS